MKATKFFTARSTVTALFTAVTVSLLAANLLPQRTELGGAPQWLAKLPAGLRFLEHLQLDNIVGSAWFAVLILLFCVSLIISTVNQYRATCALLRHPPSAAPAGGWRPVCCPSPLFASRLAAAGYRDAAGGGRYSKHRAGHWGNFLLHLGLVLVALFSLAYVVTEYRVALRLVGDEISRLTPETVATRQGILPVGGRLPASVTLTRVTPRFYANDKLESLASELYLTERAGDPPEQVEVALSDKAHFRGLRVYQANAFGVAFDLELAGPGGEFRQARLFLPYPERRGRAGYGEAALPGTDLTVKGKFLPDGEGKSMEARLPLLTVRLLRGTALVGETTLRPGEKGTVGAWRVRLAQAQWWTEILLDGSRGMSGIFAGFAVLLAGVLCSYCLAPREILVREEGGQLVAQLQVRRFADFYRDEFDTLISAPSKGDKG